MLYIATHNLKKFAEIKAILGIENCQSAADINDVAPHESGLSFVENALIKARSLAAITHGPVIADDSGLVIPSLNGEPGIYSARYAGEAASDSDNIAHLLKQFQAHPEIDRQAFFVCVMVYITHALDPCPIIAEGRLHGEICIQPRGTGGFGYDPVFYIPKLQETLAELAPEVKNQMSHRFHALQSLKQQLNHHV